MFSSDVARVMGLLLLVTATPQVFAQKASGSISGTVTDPSEAILPGADVYLANQGTRQTFHRVASEGGVFVFPALVPGLYTLRVSMPGFQTLTATDIKVEVGKEFGITATLTLGDINDSMTVVAGSELIQKTETSITSTKTQRQIEELPIDGRNALHLVRLTAGSASNNRTYTVIAGSRTSYTTINMDGVNIQDNFVRIDSVDWSPAAPGVSNISEFTVTTQNQGAEAGFGSSQINMVTPSGTNEFHGEVFWFHRNDALAANSFFNNRRGIPKRKLIRNQFGVVASGPIIQDKLFLFGTYEGNRGRSNLDWNRTILTPDAREGLFTYLDPNGSPVKVDVLEAAGIERDPFMEDFMNRVPTEINNFETGDSSANLLKNTAGHSIRQREENDADLAKLRVDFYLNESHSIEFVYQLRNVATDTPIGQSFNEVPDVFVHAKNHFFSTAWKWAATPTFLNEVRFGAFLDNVDFINRAGFPDGFKLEGTVFTSPVNDFEDRGRQTRTWTIQDNASWQLGAHSLRFGFQSNLIGVKNRFCYNCTPSYTLGLGPTQPLGLTEKDFPTPIGSSDLNAANQLMSNLGGILSSAHQAFSVSDRNNPDFKPVEDVKNWSYDTYALYLGDTWRLNPRLTLNLGLRWEFTTEVRERDNLITQVIPTSGQTMAEALLDPEATYDFIDGDLVKADWNNLAPSLGLAWDLFGNGKTVLRAGYGLSYVNDEAISSTIAWVNRHGIYEDAFLQGLTGSVSQGLPTIPAPAFELPLGLPTIAERNPARKDTLGVDPNLVTPYVQTWNLGLQRRLGWDAAIEVRYVGTKGTKLRRGIDINQIEIFENGFLEDFLRARQNGFLSLNSTGTFDPYYNPAVSGSQELTIFPRLPLEGLLFVPFFKSLVRQGTAGQIAFVYQENDLTGGFPFNQNPNANVSDLATNQASSVYHALQLEVRRRFSDGLVLDANYTFSKVMTDASGTTRSNFEPHLDINNPHYDWGRADFDLTHAFNLNFIYELPFGPGRHVNIENGFWNQVLGGWSLSSILRWQSGLPFGIYSRRGTLNWDGRSRDNRVDTSLTNGQIRDLIGVHEQDGKIYLIDPSVIGPDGRGVAPDGQEPFTGQAFFHPGPGELGGLARNAFNAPSFLNWDFRVMKDFPVTESLRVRFMVDFFNFLNHTNFTWGEFGVDSANFAQLTNSSSPRIIQLGLRVMW